MIVTYPRLQVYSQKIARLTLEALTVRLRLVPGSHVAGYDPVNLDNLLAWAVLHDRKHIALLLDQPDGYDIPLPLKCLWRDGEGLPLWACTPLLPEGVTARDVHYWHKRAQPGDWTGTQRRTFAPQTTAGRWMERRVPLPGVVAESWSCRCIGASEEIARLLQLVTYIGKKRTNGHGEVESWQIEPGGAFSLVENGCLTRSLPAAALDLLAGARPAGEPSPIGWTPPQWKPSLLRLGWPVGADVQLICHQ